MTMIPDLRHTLDDTVADDEARQRFFVADDAAAAWAMRKLRAVRAKQAEQRKIADDEITRVKQWLADVIEPMERDAAYFEQLLTDYALRVRADADDGRKSISLPTGRVATRTTADKVTVDEDVFLPWARQAHPDLIRVKESANLAAIKDMVSGLPAPVTDDGELIPGVSITPGGLSVTVTPDLT